MLWSFSHLWSVLWTTFARLVQLQIQQLLFFPKVSELWQSKFLFDLLQTFKGQLPMESSIFYTLWSMNSQTKVVVISIFFSINWSVNCVCANKVILLRSWTTSKTISTSFTKRFLFSMCAVWKMLILTMTIVLNQLQQGNMASSEIICQ